MSNIIITISILLAIIGLTIVAVNQNEKVECLTWQEQAREFDDFYLTDWQEAQCEKHEISVG